MVKTLNSLNLKILGVLRFINIIIIIFFINKIRLREKNRLVLDSSWNYKKNSPGGEHTNSLITIDFFKLSYNLNPSP